ncbi:MAG: hypothetical protein R3A50_07250 [Saprospiraceae bacterium]|nr:hypothetical protein [Saprospiraceae bacterium]MCB9345210.1 hypothetical protein [Lewinellaceae bacterium]
MFEQNVTLGPGTGTFSQHTFEILIMLIGAFLIGLWLGWALWAKYKRQIDKITLENQSLVLNSEAMRTELTSLKSKLTTLENDNNNFSSEAAILNSSNSELSDKVNKLEADLDEAQAKIRQLDTELGLAKKPEPVKTEEIALEVNETKAAKPEKEKKEVAVETVMAENSAAPTVIEPMSIKEPEKKKSSSKKTAENGEKTKVVAKSNSDDLTVIEGIGPKIQMLLNQYQIYNYHQLAETEVEKLKEILAAAGPQLAMHDPGTWPSQANLAANDQWETLKSVQGFLKGGKKPT